METLPRTILAMALAGCGIGSASAVSLARTGFGQALVYPYYTVNKNNQTLVSVVNTTNRTKAMRVRFLEGRNAKPVLDFNLYLSPFDVWTGVVFGTAAAGPAYLASVDTSCTVPRIVGSRPFSDAAYTGTNQDWDTAGTAPDLAAQLGALERTREGHLEVIEMGLLQFGTAPGQLADEATHAVGGANQGIPVNCAALVNAWVAPSGVWAANATANIDVPVGGLFGSATIVDVANGTLQAYQADAFESFYSNAAAPGFLHRSPGSPRPDLGDADNGNGIIVVNSGEFAAQTVPAGARTLTTNQAYSFDAVSMLYMHNAIYNEFITESALGAASEWVITFPTKGAYAGSSVPNLVRGPFTDPFRDNGRACEPVNVYWWNREEQISDMFGGVVFFPPPPGGGPAGPVICHSSQVLAVNQAAIPLGGASSIFGSTYPANFNARRNSVVNFESGWARVSFDTSAGNRANNLLNNEFNQFEGLSFVGLPLTGFWSVNYVNANAQPGVIANYSGAQAHRTTNIIGRFLFPPQ